MKFQTKWIEPDNQRAIIFNFRDIRLKRHPYTWAVHQQDVYLSLPCHAWLETSNFFVRGDGVLCSKSHGGAGSVQCPNCTEFHAFVVLAGWKLSRLFVMRW